MYYPDINKYIIFLFSLLSRFSEAKAADLNSIPKPLIFVSTERGGCLLLQVVIFASAIVNPATPIK